MTEKTGNSDERFEDILRELARGPTSDDGRGSACALVGSMLGHYRVLSFLGEGGMGTVYMAQDTRLLRKVALKVMRVGPRIPSQWDSVLHEARAAAAVVHPNVASVFDVGEHDGHAFIVMEFVPGRSLRKLIPRRGLGWRDAWRHGTQIANGLAHAHRLGIVHGDLKPDNVMVTEGATTRILDFGLARSLLTESSSTDMVSEHAGTPQYMAPEQRRGGKADKRTDVFALGVILHEMLTGVVGRAGDKPEGVPAPLAKLVARCLSMDAAARPADAAQVARALERCAPSRYMTLRMASAAICTTIIAGLWIVCRPAVPHALGRAEQLTWNSAEAPVSQAALSPDGTQVAYVDTRGLLVMQVPSRQERLLLDRTLVDWFSCLSWFEDGRRLLVRRKEDRGKTRFMVVDVVSGQASEFGPTDSWFCGTPSPDGSRVAYTKWMPEERVELGVLEVARPDRPRTLFATSHDERLFSTVDWSRDGTLIAFGSYAGRVEVKEVKLLVADPLTGETRPVVSDPRIYQQSYTAGFTWTSDRSLVYALAPRDPFRERQELRLLTLPKNPLNPSVSVGQSTPFASVDGSVMGSLTSDRSADRLAYVRYTKQADVWIGRFQTGDMPLADVRRLTLSERNEWPSDWDSEGSNLLLVAEGRDGYVASQVPTSGGVVTPIASVEGWTTWPIQRSDGTLFWQVDAEAGRGPVSLMMKREGDSPTLLFSMPQTVRVEGTGRPPPREVWVRCTQDGNRCIVARQEPERGGIVLDELLSGGEVRRLGGPIDVPWTRGFGIAPDGERVVVVDQTRRRVLVCSTKGEVLEDLRTAHGTVQFATWTRDGSGLVVSITEPGIHSLELWKREGIRSVLWTSDWAWLTHPVVSRDGQRLAFAVTPFHGNVWSLQP